MLLCPDEWYSDQSTCVSSFYAGFDSRMGCTEDLKNDICCFSGQLMLTEYAEHNTRSAGRTNDHIKLLFHLIL